MKFFLASIFSIFFFINSASAQEYVSAIGIRASHTGAVLTGKIGLSKHNYVEGGFGLFSNEPALFGASAAYHRHFMLTDNNKLQAYAGPVVRGVVGDANTGGFGVDLGITAILGKVNIGLELNPTVFLDDSIGFEPLYGIHLRWINY